MSRYSRNNETSITLPEIDVKKLLYKFERLADIKLPRTIIETSIIPEQDLLYMKFQEPQTTEIGDLLHPDIHIFHDEKTSKTTAIEILNYKKYIT